MIARPARSSSRKPRRIDRARRPAPEPLEARALLSRAGLIDPGFGTAGSVVAGILPGAPGAVVGALAAQSTGKILALEATYPLFGIPSEPGRAAVERLNADGTLDRSFGTGGVVALSGGTLTVQPDDKFLVLGSISDPARDDYAGTIARYNADGTPDAGFGVDGVVTLPEGAGVSNFGVEAKVASNGQILILTQDGFETSVPALIRLDPDGSVDTGFGTGEYATFSRANADGSPGPPVSLTDGYVTDTNADFAIEPDGSIAGVFPNQRDHQFITYKLTAAGQPDLAFGVRGESTIPYAFPADLFVNATATSIAAEPDGSLVESGQSSPSHAFNVVGQGHAVLLKLTPSGALDTSFAGGVGEALGAPYMDYDSGRLYPDEQRTTILPDGKILQDATFRFDADGTPDALFDATFPGNPRVYATVEAVLPDGDLVIANDLTVSRYFGSTNDVDDLGGAGVTNPTVYIPGTGTLAYRTAGSADTVFPFGTAGTGQSLPAAADYQGIGRSDLAVYLPATGSFLIRPITGGADLTVPFGSAGAGLSIPVPADYDASGKAELAVYLPASGSFAYRPSGGGADVIIPFGSAGSGQSIPVPGDYDGSGRTELAVYLPSLGAFAYRPADGGPDVFVPFGIAGSGRSIPVPGDYDGSGRTELAVYLPSLGAFAYRPASDPSGKSDRIIPFGLPGLGRSLPMPGDYDGSGRTELAVYLPVDANFAYRPAGGGPDVLEPIGIPGPGQTLPFVPAPPSVAIAGLYGSATTAATVSPLDFVPSALGRKATPGAIDPPSLN